MSLQHYIGRVKHIYQTEGLLPVLKRAFTIVHWHIFRNRTFFLSRYFTDAVAGLNEADYIPKVDNFTFEIITTNEQAEQLERNGFILYSGTVNVKERLDAGAVAFCAFVDNELASIGWLALDRKAMRSLLEPLISVNFAGLTSVAFQDAEAYSGGAITNPNFRGKGLHTYVLFKRLQYLHNLNIKIARVVIADNNQPSLQTNAKFPHQTYARGRLVRILHFQIWRETPIDNI
jgi:hypothetical protein